MAIIFGALLLQGIVPGPGLIRDHPDLFWGVVNSMYLGNIILLILSVPLVGIFVRILHVRPAILAAITVLITLLGVYTVRNSVFDMGLVIVFGILGYLMKKFGYEPAPLVLAFVLGGLMETAIRQSLRIFQGDVTGFVSRPISGTLFAAVVLLIVAVPIVRKLLKDRAARRENGIAATLVGKPPHPSDTVGVATVEPKRSRLRFPWSKDES
jgi:putative tricarboxylic transport membrane protein